ncbi:TetR family transcriptional regulator [Tamaricihabitans halophyticus]|uniref:TetR family transcriptional regulator n=1 Tax=Tamaricihabitans halophyticus TaxID=1262583 RepID=A0A4R2QE14_9PSEU|nr:TetR family transcriptional regulator C-terminal domain-containing protein [Tamaricihabitans halophyticus]TCP47333.1 TetR family transcriptional regulator [Tamaricihabitans halophyticus]
MATTRTGGRGSTQARSREKRERLLRAASELVTEGGTRALTHRAVSARAGLPPAAAGYYFRTQWDLRAETLRHNIAERIEAVREVLQRAAAAASDPVELSRNVAEGLVAIPSDVMKVRYEFYVEASRDAALREVVSEAARSLDAVAVPLLRSLGIADPDEAARSFFAVGDGFAFHRLIAPRDQNEEIEQLQKALLGVFHVYTSDRPTFEAELRMRDFTRIDQQR